MAGLRLVGPMNALLIFLFLCEMLVSVRSLNADEIASPDGQFRIIRAEPLETTGGVYQLQRATLQHGKGVIWEYASSSRALKFSWSPDSRHCLFAQVNGQRDVSLFLITLDEDNSPRLQEISMSAVHEAIIAPIPQFYNREGGYAPVQVIDWESIRWVTPTRCQFLFIDRNVGLDSEAKVQVDLEKEHPKMIILSTSDKFEKPAK